MLLLLPGDTLLSGVFCPLLLLPPDDDEEDAPPWPLLGIGAMAVSNCRALAGGDQGHCTRGGCYSGRCCLDLGDVWDVEIGEGTRRRGPALGAAAAAFSSTGGMVMKDGRRKVDRERERGGGLEAEW